MPIRFADLVETLRSKRAMRKWAALGQDASALPPAALRRVTKEARALRRDINALTHFSDAQLKGPSIDRDMFDLPEQCDWSWRPDAWRGSLTPMTVAGVENGTAFGGDLKLFHDCPLSELTVRQSRNKDAQSLAPFGLAMDVLGFKGGFLSLVMDMPDEGRKSLRTNHIVRVAGAFRVEAPLEIFVRLNLRQGPNTDQMVVEAQPENGQFVVEFDLGYQQLNLRKLEHVWLDVIFERPAMNRIEMHDLTVSRRPRADI